MISTEELYKRISESLLIDYTSVYYVDAVTNEYFWFSVDPDFYSLRIEPKGDDFFVNIVRDAQNVIYPDDLHIFLEDMKKEKIAGGNESRAHGGNYLPYGHWRKTGMVFPSNDSSNR